MHWKKSSSLLPLSEPSLSMFPSEAMASFPPQKLPASSGSESNLGHNHPLSPKPSTRPPPVLVFQRKTILLLLTLRSHAVEDAPARPAGARATLQTRTFNACRKNWPLCRLPTLVPWRPTSFFSIRASFREEDRTIRRSQPSRLTRADFVRC